MKCKICGKELDGDATLCASCEKENSVQFEIEQLPTPDAVELTSEEKEETKNLVGESEKESDQETEMKPGIKPWKVILCTLGGILLLAAITFAVLYGAGVRFATAPATEPPATEAPTDPEDPTMATLPTAIRDVYTVSDEEAQEKASEIVARVGNKTLTNDQLQMFYWANILSFLRDYGSYLPSLGLDITQPLSEQYFDEATKTTWEQYFLDYTLHVWHRYTAVCLLGEEAGYVLDAETQEYMDNLADSLEEIAVEGGFESGLALLQTQAGPGITVDGYLKYMYTCQYSMGYFDLVYESMDPPMEDLEAFYEENIDAFAQNGITKESGNLVDVRHILICPEGGTVDENNKKVYSEEEWAACLEKAQQIYDEWKAGEATEDSFAELANTHSVDPGSNTEGGLYPQVAEGEMVPEFNDWIFDPARVYGDTDLVKTSYGYHIMFFVKSEPEWVIVARIQVVAEQTTQMIDEAIVRWPLEVEYDAIVLGQAEIA